MTNFSIRAIALCLASALYAQGLVASAVKTCATVPESDFEQIVIAFDQTTYRDAAFIDSATKVLLAEAKPGRRMILTSFGGRAPLPQVVGDYQFDTPVVGGWNSPLTSAQLRDAQACQAARSEAGRTGLQRAIQSALSRSDDDRDGASPILGALRHAMTMNGTKPSAMWILSDGWEYARIDFYSAFKSSTADDILAEVERQQLLPDLSGVNVTLIGLGARPPGPPGKQVVLEAEWLTAVWSRILTKAGARGFRILSYPPPAAR